MLPEVEDAHLTCKIEWEAGIGRHFVSGTLHSGREYEVPLDLDMEAVFNDTQGAWLSSIELARELKKAAQAFRVAIALEGTQPARTDWKANAGIDPDRVYGLSDNTLQAIRVHQQAAFNRDDFPKLNSIRI